MGTELLLGMMKMFWAWKTVMVHDAVNVTPSNCTLKMLRVFHHNKPSDQSTDIFLVSTIAGPWDRVREQDFSSLREGTECWGHREGWPRQEKPWYKHAVGAPAAREPQPQTPQRQTLASSDNILTTCNHPPGDLWKTDSGARQLRISLPGIMCRNADSEEMHYIKA